MTDLNNIWKEEQPDGGKPIPEEQLMAYMEGRLSGPELRAVEEWLSQEGMESDAVEGLQAFDAGEVNAIKTQLNLQLQQSLKKKKRRQRRGIMEQKWSWMAICIILLLAILAFAVVYLTKK